MVILLMQLKIKLYLQIKRLAKTKKLSWRSSFSSHLNYLLLDIEFDALASGNFELPAEIYCIIPRKFLEQHSLRFKSAAFSTILSAIS